jgi:hypothetical protein
VLELLHGLERLPAEEKRRTALFIPYSFEGYWGAARTIGWATLPPALTGLAMVNGLPEHPEPIVGYGGMHYDYSRTRRLSPARDAEEIRQRAQALGLSRVLVVQEAPGGAFRVGYLDGEGTSAGLVLGR